VAATTEASGAVPPLVATKLLAPQRRRGTVERPRLTRLADGELPPLTLLSAPAGFGKTTLLAGWFGGPARAGRSTAWLSLDARDDDATVFWSAVVAALQTAAPDLRGAASSLLRAGQPLEAVVGSLINDLAGLGHDLIVVLDDYHVIESPEIHGAMAYLLAYLPPQVHVVLAGRVDPPLPLARLRARGELREIRAADLRFTADEAATYLNEAMGLGLTARDVATLEARTEGWIAALQLAALSMQGREDTSGFIASFAGDDRYVLDYLAEEVLERQPGEVRSFLLDTAVLDRLTGSLCDAVTRGSGGRAMLERLDRANLFVVPLDDRRRWYRYHHLFADVLRARQLDQAPERLDELHRRASAWYEAAGERPEAITHAMAGHDVERAARLVELTAPFMRRTRQEVTLRRWLTDLPDEVFTNRPVLSMAMVGARMLTGDIAGVETLLQRVERWFDPPAGATGAIVFDAVERERLPAQAEVYRAALALMAGDLEGTIVHASRGLDLAQPEDHLCRGSAPALLGLAHWTLGQLDTANRRYHQAIANLTAAGHLSDVLGCSLTLADIQVAQGRLGDAMRTCQAGLELATANDVVRGTADLHVGLAEVLIERHDLAAALEHLEASAQLGEQARLPQHPYRWRVAMARIRHAEGDTEAALALLDEAERVYDTDLSPPVRPVAATRARVLLASGDLAAARRWVAACAISPDDDLSYLHEYEHLTLARVLLAEGDANSIGAAVRLLERLRAAADDGRRLASAIDALVGLALAHQARGDGEAATAVLEQALDRAADEGHRRVFIDVLPTLAPLLRAIPRHGVAGEQARLVLAAATSRPSRASRQGLVDELSSRELQVLDLLRGDLSGPDIARELLVSLNTVRTHTRNIYMKLGVTSRREAVRRAAELGL
jgi:LuxR family maltose regulon positive regulatory protein